MHLRKPQIRLLEVPKSKSPQSMKSPKSPESPTKIRANSLFITQRNIDTNFLQIQQNHDKLNEYIEDLGKHVSKRVQKNDAQILVAYRNHFNLVKKDLQQLRKEPQAHANSSNSFVETIQYLQKKLSIFRDESIKLFQKLQAKQKELDQLKIQMSQIKNENKSLVQTVKSITRQNKYAEAELEKLKKNQVKRSSTDMEEDFTQMYNLNTLNGLSLRNKSRRHNRTTISSAHPSKTITYQQTIAQPSAPSLDFDQNPALLFAKKVRPRLGFLQPEAVVQVMQIVEDVFSDMQRATVKSRGFERGASQVGKRSRLSQRSKSIYTVDYGQQNRKDSFGIGVAVSGDESVRRLSRGFSEGQSMRGLFYRCVEVVRKQIVCRRESNSINFYKDGSPISLQQFKKFDCLKLMTLAFSQQRILQGLYSLLLKN